MSEDEARAYHQTQIETFAATDADMVAAFTINYAEEAIGVIRAAKACAMPVAIAFTLETDGRLPSGESLHDAIVRTDDATQTWAAYFMINCAHPSHFAATLGDEGAWRERIRGVRANASKRSHAELDEADDLDDGDPDELGRSYGALRAVLPRMTVVGGCCGTDHRHVGQICRVMKGAWAPEIRVDTALRSGRA
jgi:S-methylmethionine-dependent homocysteine/selenocysteine methylase